MTLKLRGLDHSQIIFEFANALNQTVCNETWVAVGTFSSREVAWSTEGFGPITALLEQKKKAKKKAV